MSEEFKIATELVRTAAADWPAFTGEDVDRNAWVAMYGRLKAAIAHDFGFGGFATRVHGIGTK